MRNLLPACVFLIPGLALADAPKVVTSIKPVHDLVATLMKGAGEPELLLRDNGSPHHASLRPSQMRALADADVIIWVGQNMEPWMEKGLEVANPEAERMVLADLEGVRLLRIRQPATLAPDEDQVIAAEEASGGYEGEEDSDFFIEEDDSLESAAEEEAIAEEEALEQEALASVIEDEDHEEEENDHEEEGHEHESGLDPHVWLDPDNSALFLDRIARLLADLDPDNSETYLANAETAKFNLAEAVLNGEDKLTVLTDARFVFNHDTFHYFETAFGIKGLGSLSTATALKIGAKSVSKIEGQAEIAPVLCVVIDDSESARAVTALFPMAKTITLSPLGFGLDENDSYPASLFISLFEGFADCS
jgi:zinc transport system substrate-binding protein